MFIAVDISELSELDETYDLLGFSIILLFIAFSKFIVEVNEEHIILNWWQQMADSGVHYL